MFLVNPQRIELLAPRAPSYDRAFGALSRSTLSNENNKTAVIAVKKKKSVSVWRWLWCVWGGSASCVWFDKRLIRLLKIYCAEHPEFTVENT